MKNKDKADSQGNLFLTPLEKICSENHALMTLSKKVDWDFFDEKFGSLFHESFGRPSARTRLIVGLHFLKAMFNESDESVVEKWVENPCWQYFCGELGFQHELPIDPTTLNKWRKKIWGKRYGVPQRPRPRRYRPRRTSSHDPICRLNCLALGYFDSPNDDL